LTKVVYGEALTTIEEKDNDVIHVIKKLLHQFPIV